VLAQAFGLGELGQEFPGGVSRDDFAHGHNECNPDVTTATARKNDVA
jgi:hypothetical protein